MRHASLPGWWRYWAAIVVSVSAPIWRKPWLALLGIVGVALGAAVVVAIELAAESASRAHARSIRAADGTATHHIVAGPGGIAEDVYVRLRVQLGLRTTRARLEVGALVPALAMRRVVFDGVDALSALANSTSETAGAGVRDLLGTSNGVAIGFALAEALDRDVGARFQIIIDGRTQTVQVQRVLPRGDPLLAGTQGFRVYADIATVQELSQRFGVLSHIELVVAEREQLAVVQALVNPGDTIVSVAADLQRQQGLTQAFQTNLAMMGKLALLIGLLLVYNTMTFSIISRRERFGVLRAIGLRRSDLFVAIMFEAACIGLIAAIIGVLFGYGLARVLLELVAQTLNDLYFSVDARRVDASLATFARGAGLALFGALLSALVPAFEALRAHPALVMRRSVAESGARRLAPGLALAGVGLFAVGACTLWLSSSLNLAFAALFMLVVGAVLTVPWSLNGLLPIVAKGLRRGGAVIAGFAIDGLRASASRASVAVAALTVALAATLGVGVMVDSFRGSVEAWLQASLPAELYVSQPGAGPPGILPDELLDKLERDARIDAISLGRSATVYSRGGPVNLIALKLAPRSRAAFTLLQMGTASVPQVWAAFARGGVIVSEPFAAKQKLRVGGQLELQTERGWQAVPVLALYRDYGREQGVVLMAMTHYRARWSDAGVSSLGLYLVDPAMAPPLAVELRSEATSRGITVLENGVIRAQSLEIFDRTFAITEVLRAVTVTVAFIGVFSALMALQLERRRELAILRATGVTRAQVAQSVLTQTLAMGVGAGLFAIPLGALVGYVLVEVVNTRSFGWSLEFTFSPHLALQAMLLAVIAALLAGCYPALRLAFAPVVEALRAE